MHVYVPPAPRPVVPTVGAARRLVDGLAWLADDGEVTAVAVDDDHRLLAVIACGATSARVLGGDARPIVQPAIALGASEVAVVVLGELDDDVLAAAGAELVRSAQLADLGLLGVATHQRGEPEPGDGTTHQRGEQDPTDVSARQRGEPEPGDGLGAGRCAPRAQTSSSSASP